MNNYVQGEGNPRAKLAVVGEAPGEKEDRTGRPFQGPAGDILNDILESAGISRSEIWLTNVYKYRPPFNKIYRIEEVLPEGGKERAHKELIDELNEINPNCILTLGNIPTRLLTRNQNKISDLRGSILLSPTTSKKVVPTYHPAAFLHSLDTSGTEGKKIPYSHKYISIEDVKRAWEESKTADYDIPQKRVTICRHPIELQRELELYKSEAFVAIDIEVIKSIPISISLSYNDYHAIVVPLLSLHRIQEHWLIPHVDLAEMHILLIDALNRAEIIFGQNFKFDQVKIEDTTGWYPYLKKLKVIDTAILAHALYPEFPKNLAFLTSFWTRQPYYKDEGKDFNYKKQDFKVFFHYNGLDSCVTYEIALKLLQELKGLYVPNFPNWFEEYLEDYIFKLHDFYMELESVGLKIDPIKKRFYFDKYTEIYDQQRERLSEIAGFNCNPHSSVKDVPLLLWRELKLPRRKDTSRQTLIALLNNVAKQPRQKEAISLVLSTRRVRKARNTYYGARPDYDGRIRTSYNINGTETGRSSTSILKPPLRPIKIGIAFQQMTKHGDIGHELREIFIPDDGYCFIELDLSQAEARVVALLSRDTLLLEKLKNKVDIHSEMAYAILGRAWDGLRAKKEDRFLGKMGRHARNYDVGKSTFMQQVNADARKHAVDLNISEFRAGKILSSIRAITPLVEQIFHADIKEALDRDRTLINPYGRRRTFYGRQEPSIYKEGYATIPQGTVIDKLRKDCFEARKKLNSKYYSFFMEAHDAIYALVKLEYREEYRAIMVEQVNKPIDFSRCTLARGELVIPCELQIGYENLKAMEPYDLD